MAEDSVWDVIQKLSIACSMADSQTTLKIREINKRLDAIESELESFVVAKKHAFNAIERRLDALEQTNIACKVFNEDSKFTSIMWLRDAEKGLEAIERLQSLKNQKIGAHFWWIAEKRVWEISWGDVSSDAVNIIHHADLITAILQLPKE